MGERIDGVLEEIRSLALDMMRVTPTFARRLEEIWGKVSQANKRIAELEGFVADLRTQREAGQELQNRKSDRLAVAQIAVDAILQHGPQSVVDAYRAALAKLEAP